MSDECIDDCFDGEIDDTIGHVRMNRPDQANSMIGPAEFPDLWPLGDGL